LIQHKLEKTALATHNAALNPWRPSMPETMSLEQLLQLLTSRADQVRFDQVMAVIDSHYDYRPAAFSNGCGDDMLHNQAGSNEGSCKIFAFAQLNQLDPTQTLACFGDYYRRDVLASPDGSDHANIRRFMRDGWAGIRFEQFPLTAKP